MVHTLPDEQQQLIALVEQFVDNEVLPRAAQAEADKRFPQELWDQLAAMDLTGLPFAEDVGGSGLPYRTYLMVVEELSRGMLALGLGLSVHTLATWGIEHHATPEQRARFIPEMVAGRVLGAYSLSEPDSGSDAAAMTTRARRTDDGYRLDGVKAWVTHGGVAGRYLVMARTSDDKTRGVSAFVVDPDTPGFEVATPESKMGMNASPTAQLVFDGATIDHDRLVGGEEGTGFRIAMASLDGGRLGISACAVGLAQAALDSALAYAREREQFGRPIIEHQGLSFLLADMATGVEAARTLYRSAADRRDHGFDTTKVAAMSKLFTTDTCMQVTTDAVQVFGGMGYTTEFPVERYMREAKVLQIVEGTNQIQRLVIGRRLASGT